MELFRKLETEIKKHPKRVILPESYDPRVIDAAKFILKSKSARIILISTGKHVKIPENKNLDIIDIKFSNQFISEYTAIKRKKDPDFPLALSEKDLSDPLIFSCMLLRNNFADAVVAGSVYETSSVLRNAITLIGPAENNRTVSSFFLFTFPKGHKFSKKVLAYGDCGVVPVPNTEQLADIAIQTSANFKKLTGIAPRTAFLSFSTKGSAKDDSLDKIIQAIELTKNRDPKLICEGELQFDAAFVPNVAKRKNPKGKIKGDANVFIFPDLNSGNISYKITERIGGATATGPIIQGLTKPVMDLSRGCTAHDIVNMVSIASLI